MEEVLTLMGFEPTSRNGDQWYGGCPFHACASRRRRCFSVNVALGVYNCHECHRKGQQLQLWAAYIDVPLHPATIDLYWTLGRDVPWLAEFNRS